MNRVGLGVAILLIGLVALIGGVRGTWRNVWRAAVTDAPILGVPVTSAATTAPTTRGKVVLR
jgi:hypothetical protein